MTGEILLATAIFWPMTAAVAGYVIGGKNERARDVFILTTVAVEFVLFLLPAVCFQIYPTALPYIDLSKTF